jgi:hypothetical protein
MKYLTVAFIISLLSGCSGYVDDPSEIIKRLKECESIGMKSEIISLSSVVFNGCKPKDVK